MYQNQINFQQLEKLIEQGFNIKSLAENFNIPAKSYSMILNCGYGKSIDLFNYLYKDATIFLNRKYDKFIQANTEITSKITKGLEVS